MNKLSKLLKAIRNFFWSPTQLPCKKQKPKIKSGSTNQNNMADFLGK